MKKVVAVEPYWHSEHLNFKHKAFDAWLECGGKFVGGSYPHKWLHPIISHLSLPSLYKSKKEARLRFVQPINFWLDAYPDYLFYETIPIIWDCWSHVRNTTSQYFERYHVKTAIFTSSQIAEMFRDKYPDMNILTITEGIDTKTYLPGKSLIERSLDLLEFGRDNHIFKSEIDGISHLRSRQGKRLFETNRDLINALSDTKIVITLPKSITDPDYAQGIETLTQRYWECMLSCIVMVGHAPKELVDLIGYNPVVEIDKEHAREQVMYILEHIDEYQMLVDKNRDVALQMGDWKIRMKKIREWLKDCGYSV